MDKKGKSVNNRDRPGKFMRRNFFLQEFETENAAVTDKNVKSWKK